MSENSVNCWDTLIADKTTTQLVTTNVKVENLSDWAISSQATWEQVEGSTTRAWNPERMVKPQECGTAKAEDIVWTTGKLVDVCGKLMHDNKTNSVPFTSKLDDLSEHPVKEVIHKVLKNDANKALEAAAHAQFDATLLTVEPTSGTSATAITVGTTGTAASTNNLAMSNVHVKLISDQMKERDIPTFDGTNYCCIARPSTFRAFKDDIEALHSYVDSGFGKILNGEVGRHYEGIRFFEQTAIASESWTNAVSDEAFFFGEDTVAEAIVCPEEIRGKIPTDYGRSRGVAWLRNCLNKLADLFTPDFMPAYA